MRCPYFAGCSVFTGVTVIIFSITTICHQILPNIWEKYAQQMFSFVLIKKINVYSPFGKTSKNHQAIISGGEGWREFGVDAVIR
jgi:hypothetical protein